MKLFNSRKHTTNINITNDSILRVIVFVVVTIVGINLLSSIEGQLTLIGVSVFLAIALNPAVGWISSKLKVKSRSAAVGMAYALVMVILVGFLSLVVPPLVKQTSDFAKNLPQTIEHFRDQDSALGRAIHQYKIDDQLTEISHRYSARLSNISGPIISTAGRIGGTLIAIITVLVLTFMLLVEAPQWLGQLLLMQPKDEQEKRKKVAMRMYRVVTSYVNGQVLIAGIASLFAVVALVVGSTLAGVTINPIALAGIVFIFGLIPLIGNTLAAVIVVLFCLFASTGLALGMTVFFLLYQQVENATLQPYIQAKSNNLTPLIVFVAALVGAQLGGLLGALAAIPIAGCIRVVIDEYYHVETFDVAEKTEEVVEQSV